MRVLTLDVSKITQKKEEKKNVESTASTEKGSVDNEQEEKNSELPLWERSCKDIVYIQNKYTNEYNSNGLY